MRGYVNINYTQSSAEYRASASNTKLELESLIYATNADELFNFYNVESANICAFADFGFGGANGEFKNSGSLR
ncbi:hypothetical protein CCY99_06440 [Helicobacter sp. 16-1353]|uniref:outer membrane beta-barrel protein n=1 Tax=Helicobacter sp. 16-1353 TaxID=2004996 RepID=UPI000DCBBC72|nr:outer membrane beta-barrel protein [Helicobacter sp. 16-1353]RAX53003.1 hypothetical protein CCY99_06440 [Helicobacter sp. 16-1353]